MQVSSITARFPTGEALDAALWDLRRLGAVGCMPTLAAALDRPTLHVTAKPGDASMVRAVVRRAGGVIL